MSPLTTEGLHFFGIIGNVYTNSLNYQPFSMDTNDINLNAAQQQSISSAQGTSDSETQSRATVRINLSATQTYVSLLGRERGMVSEGLSKSVNAVQSTLNQYLQNPSSLNQASDQSSDESAQYRKLSVQLINRDPQLQEKVAQDLSSSHRLVRSRDAAQTLSNSMASLPSQLREGTQAGQALSKLVCNTLADLTDHSTMGAGLERDLAVRNVYVSGEPQSARGKQATGRVLSSSIAYIESNQPQALEKAAQSAESSSNQGTSVQQNSQQTLAATTPSVMTRYLRQALSEFPDDSTYLDIFKKNAGASESAEEPYQDKVSKDTAERIHNLISRAADTARRGNLIPGQRSAAAETAPAADTTKSGTETLAAAEQKTPGNESVSQMSLGELKARAQRLQQQFTADRQRLAEEGRLPNPAQMPKTPAQSASSSSKVVAQAQTMTAQAQQTAVQPQQTPAQQTAPQPQQTPVQPQQTAAQTAAPEAQPQQAQNASQGISLALLSQGTMSVSYQAAQSGYYGSMTQTPGMTVPVSGFSPAQSMADSSQVKDLTATRTMSEVMQEQQRLQGAGQTQPAAPAQGTPAQTAAAAQTIAAAQTAATAQAAAAAQTAAPATAATAAETPAAAAPDTAAVQAAAAAQTAPATQGQSVPPSAPQTGPAAQNAGTGPGSQILAERTAALTGTAQPGQNIMAGTVPASELSDSEVPADVGKVAAIGGKTPGAVIAAGINTAEEIADDDPALTPVVRAGISVPGAAGVTSGQSAPIPEPTVVDDIRPVSEGGFLSKIASLFGMRPADPVEQSQAAAASGAASGVMTLKGSPLDSLMSSLDRQIQNPQVPPELRELAEQFKQKLQDPVADLPAVTSWLNFITGPLSPNSPQALAMHQWAFMLLCIRFRQLGKSIDKYLKKVGGRPEDIESATAKLGRSDESVKKLLEETLGQAERLQQLAKPEPGQVFPRYIPLPPNYEGGREGGFSLREEKDQDGKKVWHLTFSFDLEKLGLIEINAAAKLPEVRLTVVAETMAGLQKVQENLPVLTKGLQDAGLTARPAQARLGHITLQDPTADAGHAAKTRNDGSSVSVDI